MPKYRWPTDPPGKAPSHSISYQQHLKNKVQKSNYGGLPAGQAIATWAQDFAAGKVDKDGNPITAPAAPPTMPQPFDPSLAAATQAATWNQGLANAEASYQQGETAWGLGYNADGSLNTANPYSQAQLLQNEYRRSQAGTQNSMAAAGQYHSGARLNAQGRDDRVYAEGSSALRDRARQTYHGIGFGQLQSYGSNSLGLSQEQWDALRRSVYGG